MYDEEVSNYEQDIEFFIGIAGTGKSTLLAKKANKHSIVLTPTHKAKEVLIAKGVENVFTIHSVLKLVPTLNTEMRRGQRLQRLQRIGEVDLKSITTVIIDEYSMINVSIMDMLLELLPKEAKVIVFGDDRQLPPVDGELIEAEMYSNKITELTTQHRAEAPEIVETFTRFANYIKSDGRDRTANLTIDFKHGSLAKFNPLTDRCLAYTNAKVLELNEEIAEHLGMPKEIAIGEEILLNGLVGKLVATDLEEANKYIESNSLDDEIVTIYPKCVAKGKLMSGDKLIDTVVSVEADMAKYDTNIDYAPLGYIEIEETVYAFKYDLEHYAEAKRRKGAVESIQFALIDEHGLAKEVKLADWCRDNKGAKYVKNRGKAWKQYLSHQGLIWDMRRPFCTTIHKSQGSEFTTVYVAQDDIKKAIRNGYYISYARLMYVALSRAIKKVVIV